MLNIDFDTIYYNFLWNIEHYISDYWIKIFWALVILLFWIIISIWVYKFVIFLFAKFKIIELLEKFELNIYEEHEKALSIDEPENKKSKTNKKANIFKNKLQVDKVVSKVVAYYVFLLFFRWSIIKLWVIEIEMFLRDLLYYLPSLFIWIIIGYFGIRFAWFIYDVTYHALDLAKQNAAKIIASGAKIIILFFTLMVVLNYTKIVDEFIINTILVWFISMLTIAGWLAFWMGWKDIAKEILESFRK